MTAYRVLFAGDDGWAPWGWASAPIRMACCDCGLVHDIELTIHKVTRNGRRTFDAEVKPSRNQRVRWRWRVNQRATAQVRRHGKGAHMDKLLDSNVNLRKSIAMGEHEAQYGKDGKQPRQTDGKYDKRRTLMPKIDRVKPKSGY